MCKDGESVHRSHLSNSIRNVMAKQDLIVMGIQLEESLQVWIIAVQWPTMRTRNVVAHLYIVSSIPTLSPSRTILHQQYIMAIRRSTHKIDFRPYLTATNTLHTITTIISIHSSMMEKRMIKSFTNLAGGLDSSSRGGQSSDQSRCRAFSNSSLESTASNVADEAIESRLSLADATSLSI